VNSCSPESCFCTEVAVRELLWDVDLLIRMGKADVAREETSKCTLRTTGVAG